MPNSLIIPLQTLCLKDLTLIKVSHSTGHYIRSTVPDPNLLEYTTSMTENEENFLFHIREQIKQDRPRTVFKSLRQVRRYPQQQLCVYTTLEHYLDRTTQFRDADRTGLLLSFVKSHRPVGTSTIGRWITSVLASSGIDTTKFKLRSTREQLFRKRAMQLLRTIY